MIQKEDKVIEVRLYTSHDADYICERPDGTLYLYETRKESKRCYDLPINSDNNK
jgi:hypothetical protein